MSVDLYDFSQCQNFICLAPRYNNVGQFVCLIRLVQVPPLSLSSPPWTENLIHSEAELPILSKHEVIHMYSPIV
jgi:hypothetical protein